MFLQAKWKRLKSWDEELETQPKLPKRVRDGLGENYLKLVAVFTRDQSEIEGKADQNQQHQFARDIVIPKIETRMWLPKGPEGLFMAAKYYSEMKEEEKKAIDKLKIVFGVASKQKLREDARTLETVTRVWAPSMKRAKEIFRDLNKKAKEKSKANKLKELERKLKETQKKLKKAESSKGSKTGSSKSSKTSKTSKKSSKASEKGSKESKKGAKKKTSTKSKKSKKAKADADSDDDGDDFVSYFEP